MRYIGIAFLFICFASCKAVTIHPDRGVGIQYYRTAEDYKNNMPSDTTYTLIENERNDYIEISGFYDAQTNRRIKKADRAWALKIDNVNYINLRYTRIYQSNEVYAKCDIQGKICALFINNDTSEKILRGDDDDPNFALDVLGTALGGGLGQGISSGVAGSANRLIYNWTDSVGNKHKILVSNTNFLVKKIRNGGSNSIAELLSTNNFNELLETNFSFEEIDNLSFEEAVDIIKEVNSSQK